MLENSRDYFNELFNDFKTSLDNFKNKFKNEKIMTYTHGQPAVPSYFDVELDKLHIKIKNSILQASLIIRVSFKTTLQANCSAAIVAVNFE